MFGRKPKQSAEEQGPETAPLSPSILPDEAVAETPAPDTIPAPAPHPESLSADHGYPSPRRCPPQE